MINTKEYLMLFETLLKKQKSLLFNKVKEKYNTGYKLVYTIQGLVYNQDFYPHVKIIFWLNDKLSVFKEEVITYLSSLNCEYKSIKLTDDIVGIFNLILNDIKNNDQNKELTKFIEGGTDLFNEELKTQKKKAFIMNLIFEPLDAGPCITHIFPFKLQLEKQIILFNIQCTLTGYILDLNNELFEVKTINDIHKKIINIL